MEADTESLRNSASQWSLAGDKQLLGVLQNIHERLVSRCQETNKRLGEMAAALDDASIDLQNVNNKFMALSNSQFIESRVYDDDADVAAPVELPKEPPKAEPISELEKIKIGLKVLKDMHEPLEILDSDSDTDSEEEISRMVLKPKDLYSERPLPYIIGSYAWQSKWHAGLLPEDSDTDSSVKREPWEREEYSESETEISKPTKDQESISGSEDFGSDQVTPSQSLPTAPKSQASVANELARRLRGELPEPESQPEEEYVPPAPTVKKIYRPEKPAPGNVFLDEPPPLEQSYQSSDEDDIFAELRRNQPYSQSSKMQSSVTEELFGEKQGGDDIFSDFREPPPPVSQKSTLFSEESEPELFEQPPPLPQQDTTSDSNVKKPIGGVSLFGNKGTESIGAAILKRNQRQSSTDEDVSDDTSTSQNDKQKDIFDQLFAKSEKEQRKVEKQVEKEAIKEPIKEAKVDKKVDLFSDNLFDDIDDIFTTNIPKVPIKTAEKNQKSLFDDDDDLFSNVAVAKSSDNTAKDKKDSKKSIFDSDDDLFSDKVDTKIPSKDIRKRNDNISELKKEVSVKSDSKKIIFDSDDELFADKTNNRASHQPVKQSSEAIKSHTKTKSKFDDSDSDIFSDSAETKTKEISVNSVIEERINVATEKSKKDRNEVPHEKETVAPVLDTNKPSLFDDEEEHLFKTDRAKDVNKKAEDIIDETPSVLSKTSKEQISKSIFNEEPEPKIDEINDENLFSSSKENKSQKPKKSIFDDDSEDELFSDKHKPIAQQIENTKSNEIKSKSIFDDDDLFQENVPTTLPMSKEETLKNEIKEEILEEIKDEIKSEIKEEVITELKDDLLLDKNKQNTGELENTSESSKISEKDGFDDEDDIFKDSIEKKVKSNDKIEISKKTAIFDDLEDDLFLNIPKNIEKNENRDNETVKETKIPEKTEQIPTKSAIPELKANNEIKVNISDLKKPPVLQEEKVPDLDKPDIFSDIFTEPPEFEKPKEPKKSKNVNALFDDDSDDEALFFKKNDPTLDEKPEFESPSTENRLFGIFQDEPPALDVDFVQKPNVKSKENEKPSSSISNDQTDSNITPKPTSVVQKEIIKYPESPDKDIPKPDITPKKDSDRTDNAHKPIGKLKTMNFNINVNALLPGASPKKVKPTEQTDGNTQTKTKSSEDIHVKNTQEVEPMMVKSISFEGKPDSQVLDNKFSKERAKIQVKRRPSTRRARKEAVRKSGIDFGDDSTDNSSSIDDYPKDKVDRATVDDNKTKADVDAPTRSDDEKLVSQSNENVVDSLKIDDGITKTTESKELKNDNEENIFDTVDLDIEVSQDIEETKAEPVKSSTIVTQDEFVGNESRNTTGNVIPKETTQKPEVTTKTVYILNDEDIFDIEKPKKMLNIVDDDNPGISTLGKVYKEPKNLLNSDSDDELFKRSTKTKSNKTDTNEVFKPQTKNTIILDDDTLFKTKTESKKLNVFADDEKESIGEDLFKTKTIDKTDSKKDTNEKIVDEKISKPQNVTKDVKKDKISIFDLSDDEDLFSNNKFKTSEVFKKEVKKVDVKAPLFGDEDDDDLFGSSSKKTDISSSSQPTRAKEVVTKSSEPVFEDPLSLLGGDDD